MIVVLSLTIGGGLLLREVYRPISIAQPSTVPSVVPSNPMAPEDEPGAAAVASTPDGADHPQAAGVVALLQGYFDAINARDYPRWVASVSAQRRETKSAAAWLSDYQSTKDGSILLYRIETVTPGQFRVFVGFTSTQDVEDAPADLPVSCIRWRLVLPVVTEATRLRVDVVLPGTPEHDRC